MTRLRASTSEGYLELNIEANWNKFKRKIAASMFSREVVLTSRDVDYLHVTWTKLIVTTVLDY